MYLKINKFNHCIKSFEIIVTRNELEFFESAVSQPHMYAHVHMKLHSFNTYCIYSNKIDITFKHKH